MAQQRALVANFQDLQKATIEQWFWIADIADRISELKSYSVDGFTGFWTSVFYFFSALGIWMLTGIRRTEKTLADVESEPDGMPDARFISQFLHEEAWIMRHIFAVSSVGVLAYFFYSYEDQILSIRLEIGGMMKELQDLRGVIAT
ncbi:hypothetical protein RvY_02993 [Ramazzottius varieornatus]|uniref:Uncharacterized protein n=1 Tax=Ramazzottius varieornatus TaxID=947166 RepID=A0A1D1UQC2_RAMVA|nr:hypothetical protein RvY_02993 [Ramazzottius varieornatus]